MILAEWNPLGVDETIAYDEYRGYVPVIINSIQNRDDLFNCLEDILMNEIEVGYNNNNAQQVSDLIKICEKLINMYNELKGDQGDY